MVLSHIADPQNTSMFSQAWKSARLLDLPPRWHLEWQDYISVLTESHIRIKEGPDELVWSQAKNGVYSPKSGYISLMQHKRPEQVSIWWSNIWKLAAPPRTRLFFWCILEDKIPMGEHLLHRSFYGPTWCILCKCSSESTVHLFLQCTTLQVLWQDISSSICFSGQWAGDELISAWEDWTNRHRGSKLLCLPLVVSWYTWLARNRYIFYNKPIHWPHIAIVIISAYNELPDPPLP